MIRDVGKKIKVNRYVEVEELVTKEKITTVNNILELNELSVVIVSINGDGIVVDQRLVTLRGADYELLFSSDDFFGEGKQDASYREADLWKMIDKLSNQ